MTFSFNVGSLTPVEPSPTPTPATDGLITNPDNRYNSPIFWLDGRCNTRAGKDHSKKYFENLAWNPVPFTQNTGNMEKLGAGTWNGDFLALSSGSLFPAIRNEEFTVEAYIRLNAHGDVRILHEVAASSGFLIMIYPDGRLRFSTEQGYVEVPSTLELNTNYYIVCTHSLDGTTKLIVRNEEINDNAENTISYVAPLAAVNMGFGATSSLSATITSKCEGLEVGLVRAWGKVLSDAEITANYNELKNF